MSKNTKHVSIESSGPISELPLLADTVVLFEPISEKPTLQRIKCVPYMDGPLLFVLQYVQAFGQKRIAAGYRAIARLLLQRILFLQRLTVVLIF